MELPCVLCCSKDEDEMVFGKVHKEEQLVVHRNCLYLSSNLVQNGNERTGILSFLKKDILMEMRRCRLLRCFYCQRLGANIGCCRTKCRRTFHTKCGYDNLAVSQFSGHYNSFCHQHIPKYRIRPGPGEQCTICFESLVAKGKRFSLATEMQSPCCRNGWYHRQCLQRYANSAGYFFKCPLCNDEEKFAEVALFGISIPNCDASWELEPNAFADQLQRSEYCTSPNCRIRPSANSAADLLYCIMCGSNPMHTLCTLKTASTYRCADCIVITPSVASGSDESDTEVDVFDRLEELHRYRASTTSGGLNGTRDLRHSKLMASMRVSSESDDDDEDDFDKAFKILNQSRQPRAKPATETSSSSSVTPIARATRRTMPATRMLDENEHENEKEKAKKRRISSRSPIGEPARRRSLQPISPRTGSRTNVNVAETRSRRTMPQSQPRYSSNMDESCVANRTRTRLPSYMANKK
ncbi:PHD finger protein 7 [Drosophila kikkawai]|uniref:PHD finger protein 7 n=1 Tax=Drosophila kikkawai TaxID=30033 RepID=A0A6P4IPB2_DROKI|nr:PHD finger protein 7 [Drosophila kikkawai]